MQRSALRLRRFKILTKTVLKTICTQIRLQQIGQSKTSWLLGLTSRLWSIGHSQADTQILNATPILLFLDLGQDGDGNGTLMQCACMTIAFHILPYFFPSQHTTLVYIMHQCISSTFDLSAKIIHIISWNNFSKQFYKYLYWYSWSKVIGDEVAEWLRRWTANPLGSARVGSNPILVGIFLLFFWD